MKTKYCYWDYNDIDDFYETSCGEGWSFQEGTLKENKVKFCPFCGKRITRNREKAFGKKGGRA